MNFKTYSLCKEVMSERHAKEITIPVSEIGKKLTFTACVFCQARTESNNLHICLRCKSINWYPSTDFPHHGVSYNVKSQCQNCITETVSQTLTEKGGEV